ncbi:MAG: phasin family protein [Candidatus Promineifilaceae bacterium]|nr:phasin family protein [Candidatus Promineifilaceae bacterium]
MAEVEVTVIEEEVAEKEPNPFFDMTRKVLLAGIGAMALAQDEAEAFVERLVERGELAEKEGRQLLKDMVERRKEKAESLTSGAEQDLDVRVERILQRMNIPTRNDINALSRQITLLTQKVDELKEEEL